ncbi:MAG: endolytic transglycosylase MltG [Candidatus Portnoybacteria bacterium]
MMKKIIIANKKRFILFLVLIFVFSVILASAILYFNYQINVPLSTQEAEEVFTIEKGQGLKQVALNLEEEGLIRNDFWFMAYVFYKGRASNVIAGEYLLSPRLTIPQIGNKVTGGEVLSNEIEVVIPEGFTLRKIDARLAANGLTKEGDLMALSRKLEGYLFPDTYRFEKGSSLDEIIKKMTDNFDKKIDQELRNEISGQGKTLDEIIIMASLIEKEVPSYEDRQIVSGVFWQRIKDNYPLQSCATIAYILDVDKWKYSTEDTKVDSPYNTYKYKGLPPNPINNPGLSAIKAAIYPIETDYYFFLSKPDGETVFSKTLEEHNENKTKYLN